MSKIIRSSRHFYSHNNKIKTQSISLFLDEYRFAVQQFIDFLWNNPIEWTTKNNENLTLNIANFQLECPPVLNYSIISFSTTLSARALSSAATQALSIVRSKTIDVRKRQYAIKKAIEDNKPVTKIQKKLDESIQKLKKPILSDKFKAELSSKNVTFEKAKSSKHFKFWISFHALGFMKPFVIPIVLHKQDVKFMKKHFETKGSFLIGKNYIEIRYEKEIETRENGETIGCDTGIKTVATFSHSENEIEKVNGLTYEDTVIRLSRKKKGSKNFNQALITRKNVINAILNRINFDNIKVINLEDNSTLKYGKKTNRYLKHHSYGEIKYKIESLAEELGVQVKLQRSHYKSQRCFVCGWTCKSNRKGKTFKCKRCGNATDADKNASQNNQLKLCWLDFSLIREQKLNIQGFEWLTEAVSSLESLI